MSYRLAPGIRLQESPAGAFLVAPRPLRMVRLNGALLALVRRLTEAPLTPERAADARVLEKLAKRGFVQRAAEAAAAPASRPRVSIVIPVKDRAEELRTCLASLSRLDYPAELRELIVVDDGSSDGSAEVARQFGAQVLASGGTGLGPAAARNRGAQVASGEILAFIDSDCTASNRWLGDLVTAFADPQVAAVGGLVDGMHDASALDRYEAVMSSLNLGGRERSGQGGDDTFYLPSCNLLVRREAFRRAGGFRCELQIGEDVDLTWRLRDAGGRILYLPQGRIWHEHRSALPAFLKRRFEYGTSEGMLQERHPARQKKMAFPPLLGAALLCGAAALLGGGTLCLLPAVLLLAADIVMARSRALRAGLRLGYRQTLGSRLRTLGSLGYYLGYHLVRYYGLPLLAGAVLVPGLGWVLLLAALWSAAVDYQVRRPHLSIPAFLVFYLLEHLAYGAGVFWGCLRLKNFASYRLRFQQRMPIVF